MATYREPLHGVAFSEALAEAAAIAPITRVMLSTFELWHPSLIDPIRVVNDYVPLLATLEEDAPRHGGLEVEFLACPVTVNKPEESDGAATPEITLAVANVSGIWSEALKKSRGSSIPWQIIERVYASDDTSAPAILPPTTLTLTHTQITGVITQLTASFGDPVNTAVPRVTFRREQYPGLTGR